MTLAVSEKSSIAGTSDRTTALRAIIARAASCDERAAWSCFEPLPEQDAGVLAARHAGWVRSAAGGDVAAFAQVMARRGLSTEQVRRRLLDVRLRDEPLDDLLPPWAVWLHAADEALAEPAWPGMGIPPFAICDVVDPAALAGTEVDPAGVWPYHDLFEPMLRHSAAWLDDAVGDAHEHAGRAGDGVAASARRGMLAHLARRWSELASQLLMHRIGVAELLAGHPGQAGETVYATCFGGGTSLRDAWLALLTSYPVLARVLGTAESQWRAGIAELVQRLGDDRHRLATTLSPGGLGALVGYEGGAGDTHDGGRSVTVLAFAVGVRVVYKPKDLRIAAAYMDLVALLNAAGLPIPLPTRAILCGAGYAWEEHAPLAPCTRVEDVRRFYRRMGMHARLLQLLDGVDFTADNVRANGEHPVLADLETLLAPSARLVAESSPLEHELARRTRDMPSRSGIVSAKVIGDPGRQAADVGALASAERRVAPFRQIALQADGETLGPSYASFKGAPATPVLHGVPVPLAGFEDEVTRGHLEMGACLQRVAARLAAPDGPLTAMADFPTRFFLRSTHIYARVVEESVRPAQLRDGVARDLCLERLWRAQLRDAVPAALVEAEVASLGMLDIPIFVGRPNGDAVMLAEGELGGVLEASAMARAHERVAALAQRSDAQERDEIRSALFTIDGGMSALQPARFAVTRAPHGGHDWLGHAVTIGDEMLSHAVRDAHGTPGWVGLTYHPGTDVWSLGPLADDLFSGLAGLAIVFADLYALSGCERFRVVTRHVLDRFTRRFARGTPPSARCGAFTGWSGPLYACARASRALGDAPRVPPQVHTFARGALDVGPVDVVSGRAGLLLVLEHVARPGGDGELRPLVATLAANLRAVHDATGAFPRPLFPDGAQPLASVPSGDAGIALALHRAEVIAHPSLAHGDAAGACTAGTLLAALALATGDAAALARALHRADEWLHTASAARDAHASRECAEVALAAFEAGGGPRYLELACERAGAVVDGHRATGAWFPASLAADRHHLSVVTGVAGLAHLFVRLHAPGQVQSVRTIG